METPVRAFREETVNGANAQKSTGPITPEGKAASRCNGLKIGIYAKLELLPAENPDQLEGLIAEYYDQFHPATPEARTLVDLVIRNEWLLRRTVGIEAQYWTEKRLRHREGPVALDDCDIIGRDFTRIQWRLNSVQRNLFSALDRLRDLERRPSPPAHPAKPPRPPTTPAGPRPSGPDSAAARAPSVKGILSTINDAGRPTAPRSDLHPPSPIPHPRPPALAPDRPPAPSARKQRGTRLRACSLCLQHQRR
jgi:hypothetical protein